MRIVVIVDGYERLFDCPDAHPSKQIQVAAGLVVRAAGSGAAEGLLTDHRSGRLVASFEFLALFNLKT